MANSELPSPSPYFENQRSYHYNTSFAFIVNVDDLQTEVPVKLIPCEICAENIS